MINCDFTRHFIFLSYVLGHGSGLYIQYKKKGGEWQGLESVGGKCKGNPAGPATARGVGGEEKWEKWYVIVHCNI